MRNVPAIRTVRHFHDHPGYVKAIARAVNDYWMKHGRPDHLVMSFHGLPRFSLDRGDPVPLRVPQERAPHRHGAGLERRAHAGHLPVALRARRVAQALHRPTRSRNSARKAKGRVDVICPGFAADCLETLEEIAMEGRDTFLAAGGGEFHYIPTTNDLPAFMEALTDIAVENLHGWAGPSGMPRPRRPKARHPPPARTGAGRHQLTKASTT